ncbi:MAG: glycosyltransferase family 4 protein [Candidatus Hydrogenedentota bacterium]
MKILIPTADYPPIEGGISTVTVQLARQMVLLGHEVTVVAPFFADMEAFDEGEPVRVVRYAGYRLGWLRFFPLLFKSWRYMRQCDAVLAINVAYGGVIGMLARALRGTPYVVFAYAYEFMKFRRIPFFAWLLRRVYRRAKAVVAISGFTRGNLVDFGVDSGHIQVILPGADPDVNVDEAQIEAVRHKFVLDNNRVILSVGRLIPRKNHIALVRALPKILERHPETVLLIAGQGPCMWAICQEARRLGIREQLVMPGKVGESDLAALYAACDVFALPAGHDERGQVEGFGLVFTEAHVHAKPVVAGNSGGVPEAVIDGETGLLVEPDDPGAIAGAILRILDDAELAWRLGHNGQKRVEEALNWGTFARGVTHILEDHS